MAIKDTSVGIDFLTDFWTDRYLREYIPSGGSKVKFVSGKEGSGKTHTLQLLKEEAEALNYQTVFFSAKDIWLHDFKEVYLEVFRQVDLEKVLRGCAEHVIRAMGFSPEDLSEEEKFIDYLARKGESDPFTKRALRDELRSLFLKNPWLDNNFALCMVFLTGDLLGYPTIDVGTRELILSFLEADKSVKLSMLRAIGLSPTKINKTNARHMLRSLAETVHIAGYPGLYIAIDDLDVMLSKSGLVPLHYTKNRREDAYESIRGLIDDIDSMRYLWFVFGFERTMLDDEKIGIKSYQALWMRIQNEIVTERFNRFTDIADLDRLSASIYPPAAIVSLSELMALSSEEEESELHLVTEEEAKDILESARTGAYGVPYLVRLATFPGKEEQDGTL